MSLFSFPDDARWNHDINAVEFSICVGEYQGTVRVAKIVFKQLLSASASPEKCLEAYHLHRTNFERAAEAKLRRKELSEDGNLDLTGRDLRIGSEVANRS